MYSACLATNILLICDINSFFDCFFTYLALKTLEPLDITGSKKGLHTRVTACHITLYYYLGFSYLMMRRYLKFNSPFILIDMCRYSDAIKTFSTILLYINRTKQYHTRSYQYDEVRAYAILFWSILLIVFLDRQKARANVCSVSNYSVFVPAENWRKCSYILEGEVQWEIDENAKRVFILTLASRPINYFFNTEI